MIIYIIFVITLITFSLCQNKTCENIIERPEIRELTAEQTERYFAAVRKLNEGVRPTKYDNISSIHITNAKYTHGTSQFFVWHREYLYYFENQLKLIDPTIVLPYWDWSYDAYKPAESYVMSELMGGTGYEEEEYCVRDGVYANWNLTYPSSHCLKRKYDEGEEMSAFYSTSAIVSIIKSAKSYQELREAIEPRVHGRVHVNIGGSVGDMSFRHSSNDPVFWLHHAFVDKIYFEWQQQHPEIALKYDGKNFDQSLARENDTLNPFNIAVKEVLDTSSPRYCYEYKRMELSSFKAHKLKPKNETRFNETVKLVNITTTITAPKDTPDDWLKRNNFNPDKIKKSSDNFRKKHKIGNPASKFWSVFS